MDSSDIKKHKKDILRIASELMLEKVEGLPIAVGNDIHSFIDLLEQEPFDQNSLKRYGLKNEDIMELLKKYSDKSALYLSRQDYGISDRMNWNGDNR